MALEDASEQVAQLNEGQPDRVAGVALHGRALEDGQWSRIIGFASYLSNVDLMTENNHFSRHRRSP
ncbi:hypothetical protein D3C78_1731580 [compost metagenome]